MAYVFGVLFTSFAISSATMSWRSSWLAISGIWIMNGLLSIYWYPYLFAMYTDPNENKFNFFSGIPHHFLVLLLLVVSLRLLKWRNLIIYSLCIVAVFICFGWDTPLLTYTNAGFENKSDSSSLDNFIVFLTFLASLVGCCFRSKNRIHLLLALLSNHAIIRVLIPSDDDNLAKISVFNVIFPVLFAIFYYYDTKDDSVKEEKEKLPLVP